jgi:SAM-dependent methyltransferase
MGGKNGTPRVFRWEEAIPRFTNCKKSFTKSKLFQAVYLALVKRVCARYLKNRNCTILKTDLWNEGVEYDRDLFTGVSKLHIKKELIAVDVSPKICNLGKKRLNDKTEVVCSSVISPPLKKESFDFILDISTIDHLPAEQTRLVIEEYHSILKDGGILLVVFDSGLNFAMEMYHRVYLRKIYPEWTLVPLKMRGLLQMLGFEILEEYGCYFVGLAGGTHRRLPILERLLKTRVNVLWRIVKKIELSRWSKYLCFIAPQYAIIAKKNGCGK